MINTQIDDGIFVYKYTNKKPTKKGLCSKSK